MRYFSFCVYDYEQVKTFYRVLKRLGWTYRTKGYYRENVTSA